MFRSLLLFIAVCAYGQTSLVPGDPLSCFTTTEGGVVSSTVAVTGMPFASALDLKTGNVSTTADPWHDRQRCFTTNAAAQGDTVLAVFWMRAISAPDNLGLTTFVLERNGDPFTKSVTYTVAAGSDWKKVEVPFTMVEGYAANGYNFSFWVTFPNQEIQIGGLAIQDYGLNFPYSQLNMTTWPYDGHASDAPWRAAAAQRIEQYRKGDIVVLARDDNGNPIPNAQVHVRMKRHAFGFGTAVDGAAIQQANTDGQNYRDAIKRLFNKVVTENALKWPPFEGDPQNPYWGKHEADYMLPWFGANGITMVRGHNVIWPGMSNLPDDVQTMLKASPVDAAALRTRINNHIHEVMTYTKGKVTEWDVLNEPVANKDVQAALGDAEMTAWFKQARQEDPNIKLYLNEYNLTEAGGYDLQHINAVYGIIQNILANGGPVDGIGLQSHFDTNLTPPDRVLQVLDKFAAFGKDLQVTEFDVSPGDEQVQADYTRDYLTICFSHPAIKGFLMWGFWEGAHWRKAAAMIRQDWTTKPNYDVWNNLVYKQWWTDVTGTTAADGTFRTRGFLGDYAIEVTPSGKVMQTYSQAIASNVQPAYVQIGKSAAAGVITAAGIGNAATGQSGAVAPGEVIVVYGAGFGPAQLVRAAYDANNVLNTVAGDTQVLFDGTPAPMIWATSGIAAAIVPYGVSGSTTVQVVYQGVGTNKVQVPVAAAAPGLFGCLGKPGTALVVNYSAGGKISCNADYVPPKPGDIIFFYMTGDGATTPPFPDGKLPGSPYPSPAQQVKVSVGGVDASSPMCTSFVGVVYPGVTQINTCVPAGTPASATTQIAVALGGTSTPMATSPMVMWSDEFNAAGGTAPDSTKWTYDTGANGWGNNELENYTNSTDNAYQDGSGNLTIKAIKNADGTYASARMKTQGLFDFQYGRIEARIKIPFGQGIWPAFWMLGNDISTVGWPTSGEIDVMENIGKQPATVYGTVHSLGPGGPPPPDASSGGNYTLPAGNLSDAYHIYAVQWSDKSVKFLLDGNVYFEATPDQLPSTSWVFQHPFFILLNVAVGGKWPGPPDSTTTFPQTMLVDWVRVYHQ
jgi:endo-1,4-beta-xylanase